MNHSFNPQQFAENMSKQAQEMLPDDISQNAQLYTINTIKNFVTMAGEALVTDSSIELSADKQLTICQIIAEWMFHKTIDLAHSEIPQNYWDRILQQVAFTIFEVTKNGYKKDLSQEKILDNVEKEVNKSFKEALNILKEENLIDEQLYQKALSESNIDKMSQKNNTPKKTNKVTKNIKKIANKIKGLVHLKTRKPRNSALLEKAKQNLEALNNPDYQFDRLGVDVLSMFVGQGLLQIADPDNDEGTLLAGITALRQQLTDALGYILPNIRVMDTYSIDDCEYSIFVRENKIANGFVYPDKYMVIADQWDSIVGDMPQNYIYGVEPVWNSDCYWVEKYEIKEMMKKYPDIIAISPTDAIVEHIRAIVIKYVDSIIMTCDVEKYIKRVKKEENTEKLLESLQQRLDLEDIRKIFVNLLREEISIKDIMYIFDRLNSYAKYTQNPDILSERLRADLGTKICLKHSEEKVLYAVSLSQKLEEFLDGKLFKTETSTKFLLNPAEVKDLVETFATTLLKVAKETDKKSVILCSPNIRLPLYQLLVNQIPSIVVISYSELVSDIKVEVIDTIDKN